MLRKLNLLARWGPFRRVVTLSILVVGCARQPDAKDRAPGANSESPVAHESKSPKNIADDAKLFEGLSSEFTGIRFQNRVDSQHPLRRLYHSGYACGGIAIGDVNGDQRPDVFIVGGENRNAIYLQTGDFQFRDISEDAGVGGGDAWGTGAAFADIDNDGDLDLYVCNYEAPNQLFVNDGRGRFAEMAERVGLNLIDGCLMPSFCDYDRDGDLDVFVLTNHVYRECGRPSSPPIQIINGEPTILGEFAKSYALTAIAKDKFGVEEYGRPDYLLRNDGGRFTDVSAAAGIRGPGFGLSATWWDYDLDGWIDLYICNDYNDPDRLYRNNGDGSFRDVLLEAIPHTPWSSMGSDFGDIDNDGRFDFIAVDMSATTHFKQKTTMGVMNAARLEMVAGPPPQYMRNALYVNSGTSRFWEAAYLAGLADSDWSWSVKLADLDNDGWQDVFITNGVVRSFNDSDVPFDQSMLIGKTYWDLYQHLPERREQNLAYRNLGQWKFEDTSHAWGLDHVGMSYAAAHSDLDGDGDLDLIVANQNESISVYRNQSAANHHYLVVELRGRTSNRVGIGAIIRIETRAGTQIRQLIPVTGFLGSNEPVVHFGLGTESNIQRLTITWPGGIEQVLENVRANQRLVITEPEVAGSNAALSNSSPLFAASDLLTRIQHREERYDDFADQPLLPSKLSQLGPGMAWGDVDSDGDEDVFLGGASGSPGQLFRRSSDGRFLPTSQPAFEHDSAHEDMGALLLDFDSDKDLDLFVVSGGVECESDVRLLQDRLYVNDGSGVFTRHDELIPDESDSGGVAVAADFDRDGDLDLFVGGRVLPGHYPLSANNHLLENYGGSFRDITSDVAPGLVNTGLVTSAMWSDANSDGWIDLLITHEWGPVKYFHNDHGRLTDATKEAGLDSILGWWNSIAAGDFDGDADMDYVAGNFGLNTKYHASMEHPALIYYGEFEQNGRLQIVEAEFEGDKLFPVRGRSCSSQAMPMLKGKFKSFKDFALAELDQVYGGESLATAKLYKANTLETGIFWNDGSARFAFQPLPRLAQVAPVFGVVTSELDGDGKTDLFLAQNFYGPQPETGRMDGGMGLLLRGTASRELTPYSPVDSGVISPEDSRSATVTDVNHDGRPDLVVATNDGPVRCFIHQGSGDSRFIRIHLVGPSGNVGCVGSRVTVTLSNGTQQTSETSAGGGYLSHSSPVLTFGLPRGVTIESIRVAWPDGERETISPVEVKPIITIPHPRVNER